MDLPRLSLPGERPPRVDSRLRQRQEPRRCSGLSGPVAAKRRLSRGSVRHSAVHQHREGFGDPQVPIVGVPHMSDPQRMHDQCASLVPCSSRSLEGGRRGQCVARRQPMSANGQKPTLGGYRDVGAELAPIERLVARDGFDTRTEESMIILNTGSMRRWYSRWCALWMLCERGALCRHVPLNIDEDFLEFRLVAD